MLLIISLFILKTLRRKCLSNFSVSFQIAWNSLSLTLHLVLSYPLFSLLSLYIPLYTPLLLHANINIHTEKCFHKMKYDLKGHMRLLLCRVIFKKNLRSFDQITTLIYLLMDNFCPCFYTTCLTNIL